MQPENKDQREEFDQNQETISENTEEMAEAVKGADNAEEDLTGGAENGGLVKVQAELAEQKDKYIRLYSEFENFRRRTAKEKIEMIASANEQLIKSLLPVADDFERAEKSFKDRNDKELEGFFLIYNKFKKTLEQYGVKIMELGPGSDFNVDMQEAITQIPAPNEKLKGKIVDVVEKGYLQNDKVIRFAKVVIGS
ncbi:nucleotide exchange factor GrpE [Parachryseolinea silvisoli]|jgi:molecular chaperone GrpE|uniref:nucleotide exchange factor GrpE n=1 Tax=Parachryseolinea silvisoli TaxID=2873601 RepID=UPI002265E167|nr:nucleotide exchange factor GrpE [Parachryseolinea silvisoli]MCD9016952.1 nucleotide exchange factor GrpE [Parachryseolinea silvisoli]